MCEILKNDYWPRKDVALRARVRDWIKSCGAPPELVAQALAETDERSRPLAPAKTASTTPEEDFVVIPKQALSQEARRKFGLARDLFSDAFSGPEDVYWDADLRYARECLHSTVRFGGLLALIGESGSGKSTLRKELISRLQNESSPVVVIEPYVLALEADSARGLSASQLCEAIVHALGVDFGGRAPGAGSLERRFRRMHQALKDSARAGQRHVLIIEEAHNLNARLLKQLKRFYELEDGLSRLLSIILIAQPELRTRLSSVNMAVRELVQRLEILDLGPLADVEAYVRHRAARVGVKFEDIFDPSAMDALRLRLSGPAARGERRGASLLYPLLVGNLLTRALNLAAAMKMPKVTADVVAEA
jgi:type II secretory pathway predicted ATPase ExeA